MTFTKLNVNIVQWFDDFIFGDTQADVGSGVLLALQVDAIRYLYTFHYQVRFVSSTRVGYLSLYLPRQLTKGQLSVFLFLLNRLESQEVVVYMYAAVALDRILSMRTGGSMTPMYAFPPPSHRLGLIIKSCRFSSVDVQLFAPQLLYVLLA